MAHITQSRPDSGLDFQVKVLKTFRAVPSSLGSGALNGIEAQVLLTLGAKDAEWVSRGRVSVLTLNPQPSTLNPDPKPSTLNPKPKLQTVNRQP